MKDSGETSIIPEVDHSIKWKFHAWGVTYCLDCWMLTWVWSQFYPEDISAGMLQLGLPEAARIKCIKISILWTLQHTTQLRVIDDPTAPLAYQIFYSIQPGVPLILLHDCRNTPAPLLLQFVFFAWQLSTINYWEAGSVRYNPLTPKSVLDLISPHKINPESNIEVTRINDH